MRLFALQLDNDIKSIDQRKSYMESLFARLEAPDLIILPELAMSSYMGSTEIWQYADPDSLDASSWAMEMAGKYDTAIALGYLEKRGRDFYNSYMVADKTGVHGIVRKSEGESYLYKRGDFGHLIATPWGNLAVGICYDARRKHLYQAIKNQELTLILFPHGSPADPKKREYEIKTNDHFCQAYQQAFDVPVVYVNSVGEMGYMLGRTGKMMMKAGFSLNGLSRIYSSRGTEIPTGIPEALGLEINLEARRLQAPISFYGNNISRGNFLFRQFILKPDTKAGCRFYEKEKGRG